jgi:hypothetical protein
MKSSRERRVTDPGDDVAKAEADTEFEPVAAAHVRASGEWTAASHIGLAALEPKSVWDQQLGRVSSDRSLESQMDP